MLIVYLQTMRGWLKKSWRTNLMECSQLVGKGTHIQNKSIKKSKIRVHMYTDRNFVHQ